MAQHVQAQIHSKCPLNLREENWTLHEQVAIECAINSFTKEQLHLQFTLQIISEMTQMITRQFYFATSSSLLTTGLPKDETVKIIKHHLLINRLSGEEKFEIEKNNLSGLKF